MKMKIFVSAYACEPGLGSEIGVGWHWVLQMSKTFELWVLTRKSNRNSIQEWMNSHNGYENIHFIYFDLPSKLCFWKKGLRGVRIYYTLWQHASNKIVKKVMAENDIKIYHLLTYGNSLWPASKFGMKKFFVWGPTGGVDYISKSFTRFYGIKGKMTQAIRRIMIDFINFNMGFRHRCKYADLILCKTDSLYNIIPIQYRNKAKIFTDCAVDESLIEKYAQTYTNNEKIIFTTVGRLDAWRNFDVLVEAFTQAYKKNCNIKLKIVGEGNDRDRIEKLIKIRQMTAAIEMCGQVSIEEYERIMSESDVIINPTYKEGAVTMSFDAMALGKPLICIETGGYTRYLSGEMAVILKKSNREELIENMTGAILKLTDKDIREIMGKCAKKMAVENTWEKKGKIICKEIIEAYEKR